MKKLILFIALFPVWCFGSFAFAQTQSTSIDPNFVQIPRLSTAPACATNDKGKLYFNSSDNKMYFCNGTAWVDFSNGGFTLPYFAITSTAANSFEIFNNTTSSASTAQFGTSGSGFTVEINNTNPNSANRKALQTSGGLRFIDIGEGANKILTSDASGNATWQSSMNLSGVHNSIGQSGLIKFENTGTGNGLFVRTGAGQLTAAQQFAGYFESSGNGLFATGGEGNMALKTAGNLQFKNNNEGLGRVLTSDASGNATWQSNGAFFVTRSSDVGIPHNAETQIVFNTESFDPDDNYLTSGKFSAPRDGLYHFDATIDWTANFAATKVYLQIKHFDTIGGVKRVATQFVETTGQEPHISCSATFLMLGSETVEVRVFQNSGSPRTIESSASTYFSGYLVRGN